MDKKDVNKIMVEDCIKNLETQYGVNEKKVVNEIDLPIVKILQKNGNLDDAKLIFNFDKYEMTFLLFEKNSLGHTRTYRSTDNCNKSIPLSFSSDIENSILNIGGRKFIIEDSNTYNEYANSIVYMDYLVEQDKQRKGISDLKIVLDGKKYTYSRVLKDYLAFVPEFQKMHTALINSAICAVNAYDVNDVCYDWDDIYKKIVNAAKSEQKRIRCAIAQKKSVPVDKIPEVEDFDAWIHFTHSYKILSKYGDFITENQKRIAEVLKTNRLASEKAYYEAKLKVDLTKQTESTSYGIITNNVLAYWTYELLSAVHEYEQEKNAQHRWERAISEACQKYGVKNDTEATITNIMTKIVFPEAFLVINEYVAAYFDDFMLGLWTEGMFEYTVVPKEHKVIVDRNSTTIGITQALKVSNEILKCVDSVEDKRKKLKEALVICPYNAVVYKKMIEYGFFNMQVYEVAKYFDAETSLKEYLQNFCLLNIERISENDDVIEVLANLNNTTKEKIFCSVVNLKREYELACLRYFNELQDIKNEVERLQRELSSLSNINFIKRKKIIEKIESKNNQFKVCEMKKPILEWR